LASSFSAAERAAVGALLPLLLAAAEAPPPGAERRAISASAAAMSRLYDAADLDSSEEWRSSDLMCRRARGALWLPGSWVSDVCRDE
jgi:hypothetical protein